MKYRFLRRLALLSALGAPLASACSETAGPARVPEVQLLQHAATLQVGDTLRLALRPMLPPGYLPSSIGWASSNPLVAMVAGGLVRAVGAGQAVITASGDGASDSAAVTVSPARIPVVQINPPAATMSVGDTLVVALLPMLPPGYVPTPVDWSSSDSLTASVAPKVAGGTVAVVRARRAGQAVVTASGPGASGTSSITVK